MKISRKLPNGYTVPGVIALAGGASAVGRECGVDPQSVVKWTKIPDRHIRIVSTMSGLGIEVIRPDIIAPVVPAEL